jgi:hypothetical protein
MTSRAERHRREKAEPQKQSTSSGPDLPRHQIIANAREMLKMAREGLADATGADPKKRRAGLMNMLTYGRSVTFAMQKMKSVDPSFDAWWKPYQERMADDPLMKDFNRRRVDVVHAGDLYTTNRMVFGSKGPLNMGAVLQELRQHAPPNTIATFFGDEHGGTGWEVQLPDGTTEKVYFQLPDEVDIVHEYRLPDPPIEHDGQPIEDTSLANLGRLYLGMLATIVDAFAARFSE